MRNLKIGITLAIVLALNAIGAAAAQAGSLDVGASTTSALLESVQGTTVSTKNKLTVTNISNSETLGTVKCTTATLKATTLTGSVTEFTATPSYGAAGTCETSGIAGTVSPGSCQYTLSGAGVAAKELHVSIVNCGASLITITDASCTVTVGNTSTTLETIEISSEPSTPKDVVATLKVSKIPVTGDPGCPANEVGSLTGDLSGTQTITAFNTSGSTRGSQVSLEAT